MENSAATVDMISNLPDELLCHILSFLPTKLAFTTTLLSKRWAPLCYSLTALRFDDDTVKNVDSFNRFCGFVDKLMLFPSATNQPIKTFHLKLSRFYKVDHQSFYAWVEAIKLRRVEELHLLLDNVTLKNLTIFTSRTLVVVKLASLKVEGENLCVDLPNLKTLHLRYVSFETQNNFSKLLKACPILQNLHASFLLYRRADENNKVEEFKPLFLSKLVRARFCSTDIPVNLISNVEFLHIANAGEALKGFRFKSIPVFQNLINIQLWFLEFFHGWNGVVDMLQNCPKLQILFIRKWCSCLSNEWKCPISVPECVSSHLRSCTIFNSDGSTNDLAFTTYILQNTRLLQSMKINGTAQSSNGLQKLQIIQELSSCPRMSPECKLSFSFK
ncbi:putative F-box domain, FBD domain, leucine-rich repeat domain, L domain-containing protein [Medicago truncatula]|uniref:F-box/RNI/FBD-like domain protein n=1 Tax=Medicago truncatula TaxID=3880 RepID=G7JXB2_MEDTR|nr:FBD-associated F-box protein At4g10400 [Medicago truncatula]AES97668.2 F-box/RNI/FBD-like domain protein [Medicago truncatula]RHN55940.1 putative F-box domain, FBD domain, leucine-rich repeat domain, L domain-containing protein [Medicago truncatula]